MNSIIHPKILVILLALSGLSFVVGIGSFIIALNYFKSTTPMPSPAPVLSATAKPIATPTNTTGKIILTPTQNSTSEITIGRDPFEVKNFSVNFSLLTIPNNSSIKKATLRIYQKSIVGNPYLGNTIEVNDLGTISKDSKLEWKEIDLTKTVQDNIKKNNLDLILNLHLAKEAKGVTKEGDFAIFEAIPQLVVDIN